ncbi:MAG: N-acetylglucosamine-6-phosphate deacetylase [Hyphomicrobiales bacterium]|nr:N-acetylglucosamine-6-phosphate deacetylase [Hyphomicrobiales bacterium]
MSAKSMLQVFYGARIFDGVSIDEDRALVVEDGVVKAIVAVGERPRGGDQHDLGGGILAPGFVDWQVNGGGGVLFNATPTPEAIQAIAKAHRRDGATSILPTVITDAPDVLAEALRAARAVLAQRTGSVGVHVEGPYIDVRRKGVHQPEFIRPMRDEDEAQLLAAQAGAMVVTVAPASVSVERIRRLAAAGLIVSLGHTEATAEEARAAFAAGASAVTHLFNAMSQLNSRAPGLVGAALAERGVVCGLIADGHHVHDDAMRAALNAKGVDGIALVSDAMPPAAGGRPTFSLQGRPMTQSGTRLVSEDGALAGAAITMLDAVRYVVGVMGLPLADALRMATLTPARLLKLDRAIGRFTPSARADLVHLGDALDLNAVWFGGVEEAR